jgi:hypothetical protein
VKLNQEEKDDLRELLQMEAFPLVLRELQTFVEDQERNVLKCVSDDEKNLVRLKCRAEGAAKLLVDFKNRIANLKAKKDS